MRYIFPLIISLSTFLLIGAGNGSIDFSMAFIMFGYFWFGLYIGEEIGKKENKPKNL